MRPRKKRDIINDMVAAGFEETETSNTINFFWDEVASHIRHMDTLSIRIDGLGEFNFAKTKLEQMEKTTLKRLEKAVEGSFNYLNLKLKLTKIETLKKLRDEEYKRREEHKQRKLAHQAGQGLEEQGEDPGRDMV